MKKFEEPKLNIDNLEVDDVITTSETNECAYETECIGD